MLQHGDMLRKKFKNCNSGRGRVLGYVAGERAIGVMLVAHYAV